jgi:hypothetical protein
MQISGTCRARSWQAAYTTPELELDRGSYEQFLMRFLFAWGARMAEAISTALA